MDDQLVWTGQTERTKVAEALHTTGEGRLDILYVTRTIKYTKQLNEETQSGLVEWVWIEKRTRLERISHR